MCAAINVIIDRALDRFHRVIELKSTDIDAKSNKKLSAIAGQFAAASNCESLCNEVFRSDMEAGSGLRQVNNLVLDINGEGCDILVDDSIGETACY